MSTFPCSFIAFMTVEELFILSLACMGHFGVSDITLFNRLILLGLFVDYRFSKLLESLLSY